MKYYALTKDGMLTEHRFLYTDPDAAQTELESMQQAHGTAWPARLKGAKVEEVHVGFIDQHSQAMLTVLQQVVVAINGLTGAIKPAKTIDDYHHNELVQAAGIIRAAADGAKCNMEDGFPVDHTQNYETILRSTDRLAAVIDHIRGYRISQATIDKAVEWRDAGEAGWEQLFDKEKLNESPINMEASKNE